jgi:hypothetical protein
MFGINGVRHGGRGMQKSPCGTLWRLSYINCFFRDRGATLVGRVGVLSHFTASPAQFTQLKHCVNVICAKIRRNRIFAENRFFFVKKKCTKKNSAPSVPESILACKTAWLSIVLWCQSWCNYFAPIK